jgi:hypothetical protein
MTDNFTRGPQLTEAEACYPLTGQVQFHYQGFNVYRGPKPGWYISAEGEPLDYTGYPIATICDAYRAIDLVWTVDGDY